MLLLFLLRQIISMLDVTNNMFEQLQTVLSSFSRVEEVAKYIQLYSGSIISCYNPDSIFVKIFVMLYILNIKKWTELYTSPKIQLENLHAF